MSKDTHPTRTANQPQLELPAAVTIAVAELASAARQGLLALAVGTGLQVLQAMPEADVLQLVGPRGRHNPERAAVRHGTEPGQVTLGGRRVGVRRPRVRTADGTQEVAVPTYQAFASSELLDELALERMLAKLSTRRYAAGLEPVGEQVEATAQGTSKSAVSRRFVTRTEHALAELLAADLSGPGPGGAAGRRGPRGRALLRGRPGDHHRRHQGPPWPGRGLKRERHRGA